VRPKIATSLRHGLRLRRRLLCTHTNALIYKNMFVAHVSLRLVAIETRATLRIMKKAGRQSHPSKSTALKHDTSVVDIEGRAISLRTMNSLTSHLR